MKTNKLLSSFVHMGARLVIFASMLLAALMNVMPAYALPRVGTVTVGAQTGTLTYGTAASATYLVTVVRGNTSSLTANLSLTTALPAGATSSFSPSSVSWNSGGSVTSTRTSTLTITTNASTSVVTAQSFTVRAVRSSDAIDFATGNGSLTINKANQTISFAALANKYTTAADFPVNATANSGLAVTFTASGDCTVTGNLVHLMGVVGNCTITAHQTGDSNYNAAADVARTFAITLPPPTVSIDLCATTGSVLMPGSATPVTIWGYVLGDCSGSPVATLPGPTIVVDQNYIVNVTLHNNLGENTSLLFQGQEMIPDTVGAAPAGVKSYSFISSRPGTFLYEAGLRLNSQHQTAMGMYGALVVRPTGAPLQAYNNASTGFDAEQVLVLSELDTALNSSATPASFDMRKYAPKYFLINGKAYPNTGPIPISAGSNVLLRYVNAGLISHAMSSLGLTQTVIATDGNPFAYSHKMSSETIAPGQTLDSMITGPSSAPNGSKFVLYDSNMLLRNNTGLGTSAGLGGMLTFLTMGPPIVVGDTTGPLLSSLTLAPNPSNGAVSVALAFTANETMTGNANVTVAEYWVDAGVHTPITVGSPAPVVTLGATIPAGLSAGTHVVSLRAQDSLGNWSTTGTINLIVDNVGPATSGLTLTPNPSSGSVTVALSFNANDSASGNSNVTAAEYFIDPIGTPAPGSGIAVTVSSPAPVKTLNATIASGLSAGSHVISVRSKDALNNWGTLANINLVVDNNVGPATTTVSAVFNPNNGMLPLNSSVQAVRVSATFSDASTGGSNISNAEGFLDVAGTTGTGFVFIANDGNFNSVTESGFTDIPLVIVNALSSGLHPICVHAKDAAGAWGAVDCSYMLKIDRLPPTVSGLTLTPSITNNTPVVVSASANDAASGNSNIGGGEYFIDSAGIVGTGTAMIPAAASPTTTISATIPGSTVGALSNGSHTVYVRSKDVAGNWSTTTATATLFIDHNPPTFSSITLSSPSILAGTASINLTVNGSSDGVGGSGVSGGEYWICPSTCTNPAAGSGTAFSGLTVSVPTASLVGGHQYTVRARIRDVAGNWSTGGNGIRSAVLTVTPANNIFTDGFESGSLPGNWTSRSTTTTSRLNTTTGNALFGAVGIQAQGNNTNYVQSNLGSAAANYDARFYFNPNNNSASPGHDIFAAATSSTFGTQLFHVRYRRNGSQPQVQIQVGSTANASWVNINNNVSNRIEVVWQSGGNLVLYINGVSSQTLAAGAGSVGSVRLGSVTSGSSSTLEYFDAFSSKSTASPLLP